MYLIDLKKNMRVKIYLDFKNEKDYWRDAILLEKVSEGDCFYLNDEKLYQEPEEADVFKTFIDNNASNHYFNRLEELLSDKKCKKFVKACVKLCDDEKLDNYNVLYTFIKDFASTYIKPDELLTVFKEYSTDYITRFIQQTYYKDWDFTLFGYERWLVEVQPLDKFEKPFRTHRNIRKIVANSPQDKQLGKIFKSKNYSDHVDDDADDFEGSEEDVLP